MKKNDNKSKKAKVEAQEHFLSQVCRTELPKDLNVRNRLVLLYSPTVCLLARMDLVISAV
eukprot:3485369-Amphidinium_carterae.1